MEPIGYTVLSLELDDAPVLSEDEAEQLAGALDDATVTPVFDVRVA